MVSSQTQTELRIAVAQARWYMLNKEGIVEKVKGEEEEEEVAATSITLERLQDLIRNLARENKELRESQERTKELLRHALDQCV